MANRYWVGGTGTWNGTNTTNWSDTSGGTGGFSVPTSVDDVFIDANSGTGTITLSSASVKSVDFTGYTGTFATPSTAYLTLYGNLTLSSTMVMTNSSSSLIVTILAAATITTNSYGIAIVKIETPNGTDVVNQVGALSTGSLIHNRGTYNTNNYTLAVGSFQSQYGWSTAIRVLNLGTSTVSAGSGTYFVYDGVGTNTTINSSEASFTTSSGGTVGAPLTWKNFSYNWAQGNSTITINHPLTVLDTCTLQNTNINAPLVVNNLNVMRNNTNPATSTITIGAASSSVIGSITINGVLDTLYVYGSSQAQIVSSVAGLARNIVFNGTVASTCKYLHFRDIIFTGTGTLSDSGGAYIGDLGGNQNLFVTPKNVYWNKSGGGNWYATDAWALTSGGTVGDYVPLPQDTAVIQDTGLNASATITINSAIYVSGIDCSTRTLAATLTTSGNCVFMGDIKLSSAMTYSSSNLNYFRKRGIQKITSNGARFWRGLYVDNVTGGVELQDAFNCSNATKSSNDTNHFIYFRSGTFDTKGYSVTCGGLSAPTPEFRRVAYLRNSTITLFSGTDPIQFSNTNYFEWYPETSTIVLDTSQTLPIISVGNKNFYNFSVASSSSCDTLRFSTTNTSISFNNLSVIKGDVTTALEIQLPADLNVAGTLTLTGFNSIRRIRVRSWTAWGVRRTISAGAVSLSDVDFADIIATGTATWTGTRVGDGRNNTGITFATPKNVYWNHPTSSGSFGQFTSTVSWALAPGSSAPTSADNFPLPQDTIIFQADTATLPDNATITMNMAGVWYGNIDTSARNTTSNRMSLAIGSQGDQIILGNLIKGDQASLGSSSNNYAVFLGVSEQTIYADPAGANFNWPISVGTATGVASRRGSTVKLLTDLTFGGTGIKRLYVYGFSTLDLNNKNLNINELYLSQPISAEFTARAINCDNSTFYLTANNPITVDTNAFIEGTPSLVIADASVSQGISLGNCTYSKITITGSNTAKTLSINTGGNCVVGEFASTKTVAYTISFNSNLTVGTWTASGSAGAAITITGNTRTLTLCKATENLDYINISNLTIRGAEMYVGVNGTGGTASTNKPAARTLYWVGGGGEWWTTTKWSLTSGGTGGEALPRSFDTVVFDANSSAGTYTVYFRGVDSYVLVPTMIIGNPASGVVEFGVQGGFNIYFTGSISTTATNTLFPYMTSACNFYFTGYNSTYTIAISGTNLSTAGANSYGYFIGYNTTWRLQSAFAIPGIRAIQLINGILDTNGYSFTCAGIASDYGSKRGLSLGNSSISFTLYNPVTINRGYHRNFTLNPGTSTITCSGNSQGSIVEFRAHNLTFYNVTFSGTAPAIGPNLYGNITFNNLTFACPAADNTVAVQFENSTTITVTGTLSTTGGSFGKRKWFKPASLYNQITIVAANVNLSYADFTNITGAGTATWSGTNLGDGGFNSGITFATPRTLYLVPGGSTYFENYYYDAAYYATSSGGAGSANNRPLPQDTLVVDNNSTSGGQSALLVRNGAYECRLLPSINALNRTAAFNINTGTSGASIPTAATTYICGNLQLSSNCSITPNSGGGGAGIVLLGGKNITLNTNGCVVQCPVEINNRGYTVTMASSYASNVTSGTLSVLNGTFNTANYTITLGAGFSATDPAIVQLGTSTINQNYNYFIGNSNMSAANATINFSGSVGSLSRYLQSNGDATYGTVIFSGSSSGDNNIIISAGKEVTVNSLIDTNAVAHSTGFSGQGIIKLGNVSISSSSSKTVTLGTVSGYTSNATVVYTGSQDYISNGYLYIRNTLFDIDTSAKLYARTTSTQLLSGGWTFSNPPPVYAVTYSPAFLTFQ